MKTPWPARLEGWEQFNDFFVSPPTRLAYRNAVQGPVRRSSGIRRQQAGQKKRARRVAARGVHLSFEKEKDADRRPKSDQAAEAQTSSKPMPKKKKNGPGGNDVGSALRSVYQRTIDEQIPPDLLDLLGKLG